MSFDNEAIATNKSLILSEINYFGGDNEILGWIFIIASLYLFCLFVIFAIMGCVMGLIKQEAEDED